MGKKLAQGEWQNRRRQWWPTPVLLPGKSHGRRSLVGCGPWGRWESDTTEWLHFHVSLSHIGEGNGNPLQCSCLENPRDGGAWWAAVYGVAQSRTQLKRLSSRSSSSKWQNPGFSKSGWIWPQYPGCFQYVTLSFKNVKYYERRCLQSLTFLLAPSFLQCSSFYSPSLADIPPPSRSPLSEAMFFSLPIMMIHSTHELSFDFSSTTHLLRPGRATSRGRGHLSFL